jgi:hypothetical protein
MQKQKLTREQVREIVDGEASFSEKWDRERPPGSLADADKPVEVWLAWILVYTQEALKAATLRYDKTAALNNLRCILDLGETCAQYQGLPGRAEDDETDIY